MAGGCRTEEADDDTSSNDASSMEARVKAGENRRARSGAPGCRRSRLRPKNGWVEDATTATAAAAGGQKGYGRSGAASLVEAGGVVEDVVDAGRRATTSASRQIAENPFFLLSAACSAMSRVGGFTDDGRPDRSANGKGGCQGILLFFFFFFFLKTRRSGWTNPYCFLLIRSSGAVSGILGGGMAAVSVSAVFSNRARGLFAARARKILIFLPVSVLFAGRRWI